MVETIRSSEIDLPERREIRFILPIEKQGEVLPLLHERFEPLIFSDRNITRTIYFNNQNHEVPWGYSLKARQYFHRRAFEDNSFLDNSESYFVEIKASTSEFDRTKQRFEMTLGEASVFLNDNVGVPVLAEPLRPFVANEYERFHFTLKGGEHGNTRITCDIAPSYFLIEKNGILRLLGEEPSLRIEIKTAPQQTAPELDIFEDQLQGLGARKTVSKKTAAFSLENHYLTRAAPRLKKELSEVEIESKLIVTDKNPAAFFNQLTTQMRGGLGRFVIRDAFPYVVESGSFNSYFLPKGLNNTEGVKVLARPTVAKAVLKSESEIIQDRYGLGCILKRKEVKGEYFPLTEDKLEEILREQETNLGMPLVLVGEIARSRKAFWVENKKTGRVYHISIDRCQATGHSLHQLEVEYIGTSGECLDLAEGEIIRDVVDLTNKIVETYPSSVKPEPLTKLAWLRSLAA